MTEILDLAVTLTVPPTGAAPEVLASIALRCDALGLSHSGDLLSDPLTRQEREDLQWYLEEYWQWPFEQFLTRGQAVEDLLPQIGQRLYTALFGSREADRIVQDWLRQPEKQTLLQLSLISNLPAVLSLPWELLHSEQGYLALRTRHPVSIVRRLAGKTERAISTPFKRPLRILLVTARPEGQGFVDSRGIARELLEEVQPASEAGTIAIEFLRPPTLSALQQRLGDPKRPAIHILHFDGHGSFGAAPAPLSADPHLLRAGAQGMLAFETEEGTLDLVTAENLAQILHDSGVQLAVLTACQSAMGSSEDVFSSVAARLILGGIKAVSAMSASLLVVSAARYTEAFYRELAGGASAALAQARTQRALYANRRRHTVSRDASSEGAPVELYDWWLPHFYQQAPLLLQPTTTSRRKAGPPQAPRERLNKDMPAVPRYGFSGRSRELLQLERWLWQGKLVLIAGFGGMGKTALAREAADWFTRTDMYEGACFVSFEGGRGSAASLLSQLGRFLGVYDATYTPDDPKAALAQLRPALKARRVLLIADNLESILPGGEAPLDAEMRRELWDVLLDVHHQGAGVLLTSRTTALGDGRLAEGARVVHLPLGGLLPEDAYGLASSLLDSLRIDRRRAPYTQLRELLTQLDQHPLAIQLVLPALRSHALWQLKEDFAALLPRFTDDTESGRNRSLLASLEYSLTQLGEAQRAWLPHLAVFEGGALENALLEITQIPETEWATLRPALEQAALLTVEYLEGVSSPFLHFHPVLLPSLRQAKPDEALLARYAQRYAAVADYYYDEDDRHPLQVRAIVQREWPNLRHALAVLLEAGLLEEAAEMASSLGRFLTVFGLQREWVQLQERLAQVLKTQQPSADLLTQAQYLSEANRGEQERQSGQFPEAISRLQRLLTRIEAQPQGSPRGPGSYAHTATLVRIGRCFFAVGDYTTAEQQYQQTHQLVEAQLQQDPENRGFLSQQATLLALQGDVLLFQGHYTAAKAAHEQALQLNERLGDLRGQAVSRGNLGAIALRQSDYAEARARYQQALATFRALGEPAVEAAVWHQLGIVAQAEQNWPEAERCFRASLALSEQLGDRVGVAQTCNHLGQVAASTRRFEEAKGWYRRALALSGESNPGSGDHASYLYNLALCLVTEVQAGGGQESSAQLADAQGLVGQALASDRTLHSSDLWGCFSLLAEIAELQGRAEAARGYRQEERAAYASFAGHRFWIDQDWGSRIPALAAAQDDPELRAQLEEELAEAEANGWHLTAAMQRLWAGERDWPSLVEGLGNQEALVILRVLETLAHPAQTREQLLATLPTAIREAMEEDQDAFEQAFAALSENEQQRVAVLAVLQDMQEAQEPAEESELKDQGGK